MVYDTVGEYVARKATISDLEDMYNILSPNMTDENEHPLTNDMYLRKLKSLLSYYITNEDSLVITKNGTIVAVATSSGKHVLHLTNNGDIFSMVMLFKILLCDIQSLTEVSYFKVYTDKQRKVYESIRTPIGPAVRFDGNDGIVSVASKLEIRKIYNILKVS